ncbi:35114_t:CDS:1, partial [Gigaspora margarita]
AKKNYHTQLGSEEIEGSIVLAKSIEAIIIFLMSNIKIKLYEKIQKANRSRSALIASKGAPVVLTNNSALGKGLAPYSTDLNRCQNYRELVYKET